MFNGFTLTIEPTDKPIDSAFKWGPLAAGILKILPEEVNAKIDENCPNTVVHTSHVFVTKIDVQWTAPYAGIGCIRFR